MSGVWIRGIVGLALVAGMAQIGAAQCSMLTSLGRVESVSGNPFQAEVNLMASHKQLKSELVARDNKGRVRIDTTTGTFKVKEASGREAEVERHVIEICDPVSLKMIALDTLNKTATVSKLSFVSPQRSRPFC